MSELNRQYYSHALDDCLVKMAKIISALGVEELSITASEHQHTINTGIPVDQRNVESFCAQINQMYATIVEPRRNELPLS